MKMTKSRYWSLVFLSALVALFFPLTERVFARGGGGRGGGGGGRGGRGGSRGGSAGRAAAAASRGRGGSAGRGAGRNNDRKEEEETARREEREARVSEARLLYAKRERNKMWNQESSDRFGEMLRRLLGGSS